MAAAYLISMFCSCSTINLRYITVNLGYIKIHGPRPPWPLKVKAKFKFYLWKQKSNQILLATKEKIKFCLVKKMAITSSFM